MSRPVNRLIMTTSYKFLRQFTKRQFVNHCRHLILYFFRTTNHLCWVSWQIVVLQIVGTPNTGNEFYRGPVEQASYKSLWSRIRLLKNLRRPRWKYHLKKHQPRIPLHKVLLWPRKFHHKFLAKIIHGPVPLREDIEKSLLSCMKWTLSSRLKIQYRQSPMRDSRPCGPGI